MEDRRNQFDLIRLLLATGVLFSHSFELADGNRSTEPVARLLHGMTLGELCVTGFFVLSGYFIRISWVRDPVALNFLVRRLARIVPGFVVCSLVCVAVVGPLAAVWPYATGPEPAQYLAQYLAQFPVSAYLFSLVNLHGPLMPAVFVGSHYPAVNGSMWTIRLEFRCYLWMLCLGWLRLDRSWQVLLVLSLVLGWASVHPGFLTQLQFRGDYWTTGPLAQLVPFLHAFTVGALASCMSDRWRRSPLLLLGVPVWALGQLVLPTLGGWLLPFAVVGLLLGLGHLALPAWPLLRPRWDLSYGVYLYGWPVQKLLLMQWPDMTPHTVFALALPVTLVCAALSWHGVEAPALRSAHRWLAQRSLSRPAAKPAAAGPSADLV